LKKKRLLKKNKGIVFVISGPSGAGKTTLYKKAISVLPNIKHSVSFTTRSPRPGEVNNKDYTFISRDEFMSMVHTGEFAEWAEIHGELYGTSKKRLKEITDSGVDAILDIDVQGAVQLKEKFKGGIYIFILPPSLEVLRERLEKRMVNAKEEMEKRLEVAVEEVKRYIEYDYVIVNSILEDAFRELESIIIANRAKTKRFRAEWIKENFFK
jgi:guanylate kinase